MKKQLSVYAAVAFAIVLLAFKSTTPSSWTADTVHSRLGFTIKHLGIADFSGRFDTYEVKITANDATDFSDAVVEMSGDIASINTANETRNKHLKSADFFDADQFPKFTFKSTSFKKSAKNEYTVSGQLAMHGVTKEVTLKAIHVGNTTNPMSKKETSVFKVTGTFKRSDFGIGASFPEAMLSDLVALNADLELAKD
ncbi:YceI family protein [Mucilaginibacter sp. McL0603]|uniref:YceI family protein n=1 Tax=Mucilaginibacter sp. McL0603 TaxID=3415670 RepID=UPI003CEBB487